MTTTATPDATGTGPQRTVAPAQRRRIRWARGTLLTALALLVAIAVAGLPLYVFPPQGDTAGADLVYVIGPPREPRLALAEQLRGAGEATPLLVSVSADRAGEPVFTSPALAVCSESGVTCDHPTPFTTAGEAKMLTDYAATHTVAKTVVLTFTPHVARTRYIFAKCYAGDVSVVAVDEQLPLGEWIHQYAYQTAAFVKAWLTPCP